MKIHEAPFNGPEGVYEIQWYDRSREKPWTALVSKRSDGAPAHCTHIFALRAGTNTGAVVMDAYFDGGRASLDWLMTYTGTVAGEEIKTV